MSLSKFAALVMFDMLEQVSPSGCAVRVYNTPKVYNESDGSQTTMQDKLSFAIWPMASKDWLANGKPETKQLNVDGFCAVNIGQAACTICFLNKLGDKFYTEFAYHDNKITVSTGDTKETMETVMVYEKDKLEAELGADSSMDDAIMQNVLDGRKNNC